MWWCDETLKPTKTRIFCRPTYCNELCNSLPKSIDCTYHATVLLIYLPYLVLSTLAKLKLLTKFNKSQKRLIITQKNSKKLRNFKWNLVRLFHKCTKHCWNTSSAHENENPLAQKYLNYVICVFFSLVVRWCAILILHQIWALNNAKDMRSSVNTTSKCAPSLHS